MYIMLLEVMKMLLFDGVIKQFLLLILLSLAHIAFQRLTPIIFE
jgi:hypothetical protein